MEARGNSRTIRAHWERARSGDLRGAAESAHSALSAPGTALAAQEQVELRLVAAFCAMRQGNHTDAARELDAAEEALGASRNDKLSLRIAAWRAELAYFQGRYSAAEELLDALDAGLLRQGDSLYRGFALRIRIAILLARADYASIAQLVDSAVRMAESSGDDYVHVQVLNVLGAYYFDRATSKLAEPHARSHLTSLDPKDLQPMQADAAAALGYFVRAREVAERARYEFAAWYVAGNIERLEILLGRAQRAVSAIRKRLRVLQARGASYDEIVTRSNLAWGLRTLGHHREALTEIDAALALARRTGTFNVLLEFLHYDRSVVLGALGDATGARASYRRYLRLVEAGNRSAAHTSGLPGASRRPLEPYFLKRVEEVIVRHDGRLPVALLAPECGVSLRTLESAFVSFRGLTPVAYLRNRKLDGARRMLESGATVQEAASRSGFGSVTTFANEYRRRFGVAPSRTRRHRQSVALDGPGAMPEGNERGR
ncbi:MAG TPA: helix-turn-helix transcriptional regulator [Usitatibacter sp.]|nr:helix-turn-helix transcriptional regulator [Usitatibacter sp.]